MNSSDDEDLSKRPRLEGRVGLELDGAKLEFQVEMPDGPVNVDDLIPLFHQLSGLVAEAGERRADVAGLPISCRAGCGACCRQSVPVTEGEARYLAGLVDAMPEPRRSQVVARFEETLRTVRDCEAGRNLLDAMQAGAPTGKTLVSAYFRLGIPCPFLEDERCSIHAQRPMSCREYLVTSDPVYCAALDGEQIRRVRLTQIVHRVARVSRRDTHHGYVLLIEALAFAAVSPPPPREHRGPEILAAVIKSDGPEARSGRPAPSGEHRMGPVDQPQRS
jgi:Fe-S-cluster containining protein